MDYEALLNLAIELGHSLAINGAETFRVEECINRIMNAYEIKSETFAIPNCLHVSIETHDGTSLTRMKRIGFHGNDLDAIEKYNSICRKICKEHPEPKAAAQWLKETKQSCRHHSLPIYLLGSFMGGCGFSILFNGSIFDCLIGGICGLAIGVVNKTMNRWKVNPFFSTIIASFIMTTIACLSNLFWRGFNTDAIMIGALMILVPGLPFTNAMRDIIYGDTNSGVNRIVQVFLIAAAIVLGTGSAWTFANNLWGVPTVQSIINHSILFESVASLLGCFGFAILFNIHGKGKLYTAFGGALTWVVFRLTSMLTNDVSLSYFIGTITAALYSEIMARIRLCPALSYLVISAFPLLPGAGVYNTMRYAVSGNMTEFINTGIKTIGIAGIMAVGILLVSTVVRIITVNRTQK